MLNKIADKMFHMLAICTILYPCRIDEALEQQMKEKITFDKLTKMQGKILIFKIFSNFLFVSEY